MTTGQTDPFTMHATVSQHGDLHDSRSTTSFTEGGQSMTNMLGARVSAHGEGNSLQPWSEPWLTKAQC